jgi:hypothetical protein
MAWGVGVTVARYLLGKSIPSVDCYLLPIIAVVVVLRKGRPDAADRVSMSGVAGPAGARYQWIGIAVGGLAAADTAAVLVGD